MIGAIAGVGRVAISNALRQVARNFGREAMDRIMAGENIEEVLARDQLRELAKKTGKVAFGELMRLGKSALLEDYHKKNADWNARMNDFTRYLDDEFRKTQRFTKK